jgi:FkbM family methyltransferase
VAIQALNLSLFQRAIAIEPDPANFEMLCVNRDLNRLGESLLCLECAVSSEKVALSMQRNPKNFGDHRILRPGISGVTEDPERLGPKVTGDTLDAVLTGHAGADLDRIGLIWIDIQGHEGEAILGGHETFSRDIPVMMELWPHGLAAAGFGEERFCQLLQTYWNGFWTWSEAGFQRQEIAGIRELYATLVGVPGLYANVLMMKR